MTIVTRCEVEGIRCLDRHGHLHTPPAEWNPHDLIPVYRGMLRTRIFDAKSVALQRTGQLRTYPSSLGQEAISVGVASMLRPDDVLLPSYRETGGMIWRGIRLDEMLAYWGGDERGNDFSCSREDFPMAVPIATQCCHAVGVAYAFQLRKQARVAACFIGDGGSSKGDFYEAMNVAGVWRLPLVFILTNNHWAISLPSSRQTACETFAQKAFAAGIPGVQVDGNDVVAVREAMRQATARARAGEGATLIEAVTYRLSDHTTADDARRYRCAEEVSAAWAEEPMVRLKNYLVSALGWTKADEEQLIAEINQEVAEAVALYLAHQPEPLSAMFDYLYAEPSVELCRQRDAFLSEMGGPDHA